MSETVGRHASLWSGFRRLDLILFAAVMCAVAYAGAQRCEPSDDYYRCSNGRCIERRLVNNGVNDCQDNSDEVRAPCRAPLFSCRNTRCILMEWVLDGHNDCLDGTDEAKLIGTPCTTVVDDCCYCSDYVPHSECGTDGTCRCVAGYYSNQPRTECVRMTVGDRCNESAQCSSSVAHSSCVPDNVTDDVTVGRCVCDVSYHYVGNYTCSERRLGDNCSSSEHCSTVVRSRCHGNVCRCQAGYYDPSGDGRSCVIRRLGSSCENNEQCAESVTGPTVCNNASARCDCAAGHRWSRPDSTACVARQLGDRCLVDADCRASVDVAVCDRSGRCGCPPGHVRVNGSACRPRLPGELCETDDHCSAVNHTVCVDRRCACAYDHSWFPSAVQCVYDGGDSLAAAVGNALTGGVAVLVVVDAVLIVWSVYRCVVWQRDRVRFRPV